MSSFISSQVYKCKIGIFILNNLPPRPPALAAKEKFTQKNSITTTTPHFLQNMSL